MKSAPLLLSLMSLPGVLVAQAPLIAPRASVVFAQSAPEAPSDTLNLPKTHWKEGALIGGIGVGAFGAFMAYGLCAQSDAPVYSTGECVASGFGGLLVGGLIGGVTGMMIGGLFPKDAPAK